MKIPAPKFVKVRPAFTIIELLVALALVLFIMSIISQVFVDSSEAFRSMRAKAELSEKLRFLTQTIRADLRSNHFEAGRKLSNNDFWADGPPQLGYFRLEQTNLPHPISNLSGSEIIYTFPDPTKDPKIVQSQLLAFTSFLGGKDPRGIHSASISGPGFASFRQWKALNLAPPDTRYEEPITLVNQLFESPTYQSPDAEVAWFLGPSSDYQEFLLQDEPSNPDGSAQSVKLFKLYRRVWMMLPQELGSTVSTEKLEASAGLMTSKISMVNPKLVTNPSLSPLIQLNGDNSLLKANCDVPMRRALGSFHLSNNSNPPRYDLIANADTWRRPCFDNTAAQDQTALLADNVLSFTVEVCPEGSTQFMPLANALNLPATANGAAVFDTWSNRGPNPSQGITADFSGWNIPNSPGVIPMPLIPGQLNSAPTPRKLMAIRVTIRLFDTNNALSPSKTTWQATVVEPL